MANLTVPEYMPNSLPFWFSMVEQACRSRGVESLHLKKEVLANRLPASELLRCKDIMAAEQRNYRELTRALFHRLMPSWEAAMEAIVSAELGDRRPSDMVREWAGWLDVAQEERHVKYHLLNKLPASVYPTLKMMADRASLDELVQAADRIMSPTAG